ncbi:P-loop containing nucleoside triphosphate hydrolase protein, partial [Trametes maxima]
MAPGDTVPRGAPDATHHQQIQKRSYDLLKAARERAQQKRQYDSGRSRQILSEECLRRMGFSPREEQLDLAECMLLGLDAASIAGTGWGKTLPFVLPLLVPESKGKIIIIVSPLNALEADQAARFCKMGISATALNGTTCTPEVLRNVERGQYSVLVTGPKLLVETDGAVRALLKNTRFGKKILGLIIDEAHCISQWGGEFRPEYAKLDVIRAMLPLNVCVHLTSATMPPVVFTEALKTLCIIPETCFILNLGNDRPNITWEVRYMSAGKSDLEALSFLVPNPAENIIRLPKTMVFFDDIFLSMKAWRWFLNQLPPTLHRRVKCYHSRRTDLAKQITMYDFTHGEIDILFTTEAAGMATTTHCALSQGCDIPDIVHTVQFMAPESLSIWIQRAGRAGRRSGMQARATLLVQPSVFQEIGKKTRKEGEPIVYKKEIEPGLRTWVDAPLEQCRRDVADEYFDNPPRQVGMYQEWRGRTWETYYSRKPFGPPAILPDPVITHLATRTTYRSTDDLSQLKWALYKRYGCEILQLLEALDK